MGIVAVRMGMHLDVPAGHELMNIPTRALDQRRRAHLAAHGERLSIGADGVEVEVAVRIHEIELGQRARVVLEFLHLKQAEAVVRECRRRCGEAQAKPRARRIVDDVVELAWRAP